MAAAAGGAPAGDGDMTKLRGETESHSNLKRLAVIWAQAQGYRACALEVPLPKSNYRADVAAATDAVTSDHGRTAVFECKASRPDLLRDSTKETEARQRAGELASRLAALQQLIGEHRPDLRRGEFLFPEFDAVDLRGERHATYRAVERELQAWQCKLLNGVKFSRIYRYGLASVYYLVTDDEFISRAELPAGWGWLVRKGAALQLSVKPTLAESSREARIALLERIARAGTRLLNERLSVGRTPVCLSEH
jgi:hypothetical protein